MNTNPSSSTISILSTAFAEGTPVPVSFVSENPSTQPFLSSRLELLTRIFNQSRRSVEAHASLLAPRPHATSASQSSGTTLFSGVMPVSGAPMAYAIPLYLASSTSASSSLSSSSATQSVSSANAFNSSSLSSLTSSRSQASSLLSSARFSATQGVRAREVEVVEDSDEETHADKSITNSSSHSASSSSAFSSSSLSSLTSIRSQASSLLSSAHSSSSFNPSRTSMEANASLLAPRPHATSASHSAETTFFSGVMPVSGAPIAHAIPLYLASSTSASSSLSSSSTTQSVSSANALSSSSLSSLTSSRSQTSSLLSSARFSAAQGVRTREVEVVEDSDEETHANESVTNSSSSSSVMKDTQRESGFIPLPNPPASSVRLEDFCRANKRIIFKRLIKHVFQMHYDQIAKLATYEEQREKIRKELKNFLESFEGRAGKITVAVTQPSGKRESILVNDLKDFFRKFPEGFISSAKTIDGVLQGQKGIRPLQKSSKFPSRASVNKPTNATVSTFSLTSAQQTENQTDAAILPQSSSSSSGAVEALPDSGSDFSDLPTFQEYQETTSVTQSSMRAATPSSILRDVVSEHPSYLFESESSSSSSSQIVDDLENNDVHDGVLVFRHYRNGKAKFLVTKTVIEILKEKGYPAKKMTHKEIQERLKVALLQPIKDNRYDQKWKVLDDNGLSFHKKRSELRKFFEENPKGTVFLWNQVVVDARNSAKQASSSSSSTARAASTSTSLASLPKAAQEVRSPSLSSFNSTTPINNFSLGLSIALSPSADSSAAQEAARIREIEVLEGTQVVPVYTYERKKILLKKTIKNILKQERELIGLTPVVKRNKRILARLKEVLQQPLGNMPDVTIRVKINKESQLIKRSKLKDHADAIIELGPLMISRAIREVNDELQEEEAFPKPAIPSRTRVNADTQDSSSSSSSSAGAQTAARMALPTLPPAPTPSSLPSRKRKHTPSNSSRNAPKHRRSNATAPLQPHSSTDQAFASSQAPIPTAPPAAPSRTPLPLPPLPSLAAVPTTSTPAARAAAIPGTETNPVEEEALHQELSSLLDSGPPLIPFTPLTVSSLTPERQPEAFSLTPRLMPLRPFSALEPSTGAMTPLEQISLTPPEID